MKYRRYIVDISGVGLSRHDFYKLKSFIRKIGKKSVNIGDISIFFRYIRHKIQMCKKIKNKIKKIDTGRYIADISTSVGQCIFFFFLIFDMTAVVLGHVEG